MLRLPLNYHPLMAATVEAAFGAGWGRGSIPFRVQCGTPAFAARPVLSDWMGRTRVRGAATLAVKVM
jgi:hypothetical protein